MGGKKETDGRYGSLKSALLRCRALALGDLRWLYSEAKKRDDVQVWPFLEYILTETRK